MKKKNFLISFPIFVVLFSLLAWPIYGFYLASTISKVEIEYVTSVAVQNEKTLPFYELMSPLPSMDSVLLPKLEYKKGPPDRFIERISILVQNKLGSTKERIVYYGRRSDTTSLGVRFFPDLPNKEALFLETAILYSQNGELPTYAKGASLFLLKPFLLLKAREVLRNVERVSIMDQSGTPAFLFQYAPGERSRALALFSRRNSLYKMEFIGDKNFQNVNPLNIFRKSFLTERRADALGFLAKNLSEVHLEQSGVNKLEIRDIAWPILLLAANVSVDPASLEAYFHFAGISALLYRNASNAKADMETLDILRNNVLASEFYAKDINSEAKETSEISHLARLLTRNFDQ